jgi:CRP-like cAMP-binding protein
MTHRIKAQGSLAYDRRGPIWRCTKPEYRKLLTLTTTVTLPAGSELAHQGRRQGQLIILIEGSAAVLQNDLLIEQLTAGAHVGGLTVLRGIPHPTTVIALTPVVVDVIAEREFRSVVPLLEDFNRRVLIEVDRQRRDWCETETTGTAPTFADQQSGPRPVA